MVAEELQQALLTIIEGIARTVLVFCCTTCQQSPALFSPLRFFPSRSSLYFRRTYPLKPQIDALSATQTFGDSQRLRMLRFGVAVSVIEDGDNASA